MVMHRCAGVKVRTAGPCAGWSRSPRLIATCPTASLLALDFRLVEPDLADPLRGHINRRRFVRGARSWRGAPRSAPRRRRRVASLGLAVFLLSTRPRGFEERQQIGELLPRELFGKPRRHERDGARVDLVDVLPRDPGFRAGARCQHHFVRRLAPNHSALGRAGRHRDDDRLVAAREARTGVDDRLQQVPLAADLTDPREVGPDLPALFANDEALAGDIAATADAVADPLWRLPLWQPYNDMLKSDVADINNAPGGGFAGTITAALFLERFVSPSIPWAHLDTFAWRPTAKPGRPKGGDALGLRAAWELLRRRFAN